MAAVLAMGACAAPPPVETPSGGAALQFPVDVDQLAADPGAAYPFQSPIARASSIVY